MTLIFHYLIAPYISHSTKPNIPDSDFNKFSILMKVEKLTGLYITNVSLQ